MAALDDLKDSLRDRSKAIAARIRETDAWLQLTEKYQSLSPTGQKLSIAGASLLAFLIVMAVPWSFYSGSQSSLADFESKRGVVRELFRVNREASALPPAPPPVSSADLQNMARSSLTAARLMPDQISAVTDSNIKIPSVPSTIDQAGIQVSLLKLNLKQIVDIGYGLQGLQPTARMTGLEIKANAADAKYYDVIYRIVAFAPKPAVADPKAKGSKK